MNELRTIKGRTDKKASVSARLKREAGILAGRLGQLLARMLPQAEGTLAEGQAFLGAMYESISEGLPLSAWSNGPLDRVPDHYPHPLDRLTEALGLSRLEVELLLLGGLSEEHEGLAAVLRALHPRNEAYPSLGLAAQLLCDDQEDRAPFHELIETSRAVTMGALRATGDAPFYERSLQLAPSLWSALHGLDVWPAGIRLTDLAFASAGFDEWFETTGASRAVKAIALRVPCTVTVTADNEEAAYNRALALVAHAGARPAGIQLPPSIDPAQEQSIQIHALARGVVPVLRLANTENPVAAEVSAFTDFPGAIVVCGRAGAVSVRGARPFIAAPVEPLLPQARRRMWREMVPALASDAAFLAARYPVEPKTAAAVATDLDLIASLEGRAPGVEDVGASIRARGVTSLAAGVRLMRPRATWEDLVLPPDRLNQLREAVSRLEFQDRVIDEWGFLRDRAGARGVRLLFTGPPGTGKTLSAEVLSHTLGVDLLIIDLSRIVSKWIGETEKNLATAFDAAERARSVLFFDEADALFGKRTEVTDAHDRYANLETAYLLTRLEQFEGMAIMATNLRQNIDPAFLRRLEFVIDFEEPDREERLALWQCHLPKDAPLADDLNLDEFAALYAVVGGVIRNAAVAAGFLAAAEGMPITRHHFIHAIRREYEKAGRSFPGVPVGMTV
ncbi:MAG TPA: ATP-binding protein [Blastocatellia bacterium]|nr:ATP-binding protein [Blastocatellia bacterium]